VPTAKTHLLIAYYIDTKDEVFRIENYVDAPGPTDASTNVITDREGREWDVVRILETSTIEVRKIVVRIIPKTSK
jgi:hypothetical protein